MNLSHRTISDIKAVDVQMKSGTQTLTAREALAIYQRLAAEMNNIRSTVDSLLSTLAYDVAPDLRNLKAAAQALKPDVLSIDTAVKSVAPETVLKYKASNSVRDLNDADCLVDTAEFNAQGLDWDVEELTDSIHTLLSSSLAEFESDLIGVSTLAAAISKRADDIYVLDEISTVLEAQEKLEEYN